MKKAITWVLVIVLVASGILLLKKRKTDHAKTGPPQIMPAVVATMNLERRPVTLTLPAMGIVASDVSSVLSTRISGQVTEVFKQEGEPVKKGETLARIDAKDLEAKKQGVALQRQGVAFQVEAKKAEVSALETSLKSAQEAHARTKELLDIKGASAEQYSREESDIARLKANLSAANNSIATLQKNMETLSASMREIDSMMNYATLVAPIDGTVSQILVRPGDLATPGKPMMRISSRAGLYLNLSLPDTLRADEVLLAGHVLPLTSKDQTGETGLLQYVAPLPQDPGLIEGQFVNVDVVVYKGEDVLLPIDTLLTMNGSSSVFVVAKGGNPQRLNVTIKARGVEGATVEQNLDGLKVVLAKPDILLRIASGVPLVERDL